MDNSDWRDVLGEVICELGVIDNYHDNKDFRFYFVYKLELEKRLIQMAHWAIENLKGEWFIDSNPTIDFEGYTNILFYFKEEDDAAAFKLRWL